MLIGRNLEYAYFDEVMQKNGSQLIVFYGQKFVGKTAFLLDYCQDKACAYCMARPASEDRVMAEINEAVDMLYQMETKDKKVLIIDEFQNYAKVPRFLTFCINLMSHENLMIVLVSSNTCWVESSMVKTFGKAVASVSGFYKCRPLSFDAICKIYTGHVASNLFILYSILGGLPGLWNMMDLRLGVAENIIKNMLSETCYLRQVGYAYCMGDLREHGVYDTILSTMGSKIYKLNDIYHETGYSRAKISVYLKTLMEQEQIEKIYSIDCHGSDHEQKGIYRISCHFTAFWFHFIYPHEQQLQLISPEEFYNYYIREDLLKFCNRSLRDLVREFFIKKGILEPEARGSVDCFLGKKHTLDLVWEKNGVYTAVWCHSLKGMVTYADYEELIAGAKEAGIKVQEYYLVSYDKFDEKLFLESKVKEHIHLLAFKQLIELF